MIAMASYRSGYNHEALLAGLFGSEAERHEMITTSARQTTSSNRGESLWLTSRGVRYQNVSAVLTTFELMPWTVARTQPWLIANPWATRPLEIELPFNRFDVDTSSGEIAEVKACFQPSELFELPESWPPHSKFDVDE